MAKKREEKYLDVSAAMQGTLSFSDPVNLRINGKFEGSLNTRGNLIIGKDADVKADIVGESIVVEGVVKGNIKATEGLRITLTAKVLGDIESPKVSIEEGASFNGKCSTRERRITLEELSDYLSVEEDKVVEWVDNGKIPVEKEAGKLTFSRIEVEDWIASNK